MSSSRYDRRPPDQGPAVAFATTALFVPGDRPERFSKAAASGADVVIIDLEDAVGAEKKDRARADAMRVVVGADGSRMEALIRINAVGTTEHEADLDAVAEVVSRGASGLRGIVVPKTESSGDVERIIMRMRDAGGADTSVVPLIETARGLVAAQRIAETDGVARLAFGAIDYALDVSADGSGRALDAARSWLVVASRAAGIPAPLDSPSPEFLDLDVVRRSARMARSFGFGGMLCIHPSQLTAVSEAFQPTEEELQWARSVVAAGEGASQVDGRMVDRPVIESAKRTLERGRTGQQ